MSGTGCRRWRRSSSTEVVISGEYPAARYFSFHVYNDSGEALGSIYDQQIQPDPGSANPFQAKPRKGAAALIPRDHSFRTKAR